ncbi:MAG: VWA domain-containing protein [Deltaproteobacteria bacterium]|nr:VWA domain-containing protein [Deltaproteobacteria bacterium]MBW1794896.1 VWA domain-containing protein [Deltaproteobacteria bacterium]MBW2330182.1 VWA domain-containing protein [Deltaproteobacteria bacterium]
MKLAHLWILHFLWFLPLTALVLIISNRQKRRAAEGFADVELMNRLTGEERRGRRLLKGILLIGAIGFMLLALAGPRWGSHYQEVTQKGVDVMIVVDVSPSMLVEDVEPSRLERARREIIDFLRVVQGDRVGLVAFSGTAFVQCPLTLDYGALEMFLSTLQPDLIPVAGTDLGAAIQTGLSGFDFESETDKVILLITDGEDHEGRGLDAAREASKKGAKIFVFGIGQNAGGPIPSGDGKGGFKKDDEGKLVLSKLDEESLRQIASLTGGTYVRTVAGDLDLDILYFEGIRGRTKAEVLKSRKIKVYEDRFPIFVLAAFLLLSLEQIVLERKTFFLVFLVLIFSTQARATENPDELYRKGRFAEAEKAYERADMDHPRDVRYRYNRGCAAYQNGDYQAAGAAFSSVLVRAKDEEQKFKAAFNLGSVAFKQGDVASAAEYYRKAISYNPENEDAKYNLELALRELEKEKEKKIEKPEAQSQPDSGQTEGQNDQPGSGEKGENREESRQQKSETESSQNQKQPDKQDQTDSGQSQDARKENGVGSDEAQQPEQETPRDLSGELEPLQALPAEQESKEIPKGDISPMDKKKAEALLDNITENRLRFWRMQIPEDKKHGVASGKDW